MNEAGKEAALLAVRSNAGLCADDDHDWDYKQDVIGDYGVINGTYVERWFECRNCGAQKPATSEDAPTYDDY